MKALQCAVESLLGDDSYTHISMCTYLALFQKGSIEILIYFLCS